MKKQRRLSKAKRVLVTIEEEAELEMLVANLAGDLGTPVKLSHLQRAFFILLHHALPQILDEAQGTLLSRPPNEIPDAREEFEQHLAHLLLIALKKAPHTL